MRAAAAYACQAKVNFISNVLSLTTSASGFSASPSAFWRLLAKTYNSRTGQDYVVEGAVLSLDALLAMTRPGTLILPQYQVNPDTNNVGSVFYTDRVDDSNFALLFTSMATIGGVTSRYGLGDLTTGAPAAAPARSIRHRPAPRQHVHFFLGSEFNRVTQGFFRLACVVAGYHFDLSAEQAPLGVDLLHSQLPALLVGLGELRDGGIAVDFTDLDRGLGRGQSSGSQQAGGDKVFHKG